MSTLGAILAGGQSTRFGSDKALAPWRGRPLIDHVALRIRLIADDVVICGRVAAGGRSLPDRPGPGLGPLGGLCAALCDARDRGFTRVVSVPCDAPSIPTGLFRRLCDADGAAICSDMPVIGSWPSGLADTLEQFLVNDPADRSMRAWARAVGALAVPLIEGEEVVNVNRPGDLAALDTAEPPPR